MIPLGRHTLKNEDGAQFMHPGYTLMQCPSCFKEYIFANHEGAVLNRNITCGKQVCMKRMGIEL